MKIIRSENTTFWDIDSTMVFSAGSKVPGRKVKVYDAVTDRFLTMIGNESMIRLMKEEKHRGGYITVWSRGGYEWAANVIKALGLEEDVDQVMTKPMAYMDDLEISDWLKHRVFIPPQQAYKK